MLGGSMGHFFEHEREAGGNGMEKESAEFVTMIHNRFAGRVRGSIEELLTHEGVSEQFIEHPGQSVAAFGLMIISMLVREGQIRIVDDEDIEKE